VRRPSVSVVVPFRGAEPDALALREAIGGLDLGRDDEAIVADNTEEGAAAEALAGAAQVVRASAERSSYHARNAGAARATREWLVFVDADCMPRERLLASYFAAPPAARCGVLAGAITGRTGQSGFVVRYARSRGFLDQRRGLHAQSGKAAATGNLAVRRRAFEAVGGFAEGIRSAGDVDLCLRLAGAGWTLEHRPEAVVEHRDRERLGEFLAMIARYGAGARWLDERHGISPRWPLVPGLIGSGRDVATNLVRGRIEEASFRAFDAVGLVAHNLGYAASNRVPRDD
jgi:GT2 family glycosyltransferase